MMIKPVRGAQYERVADLLNFHKLAFGIQRIPGVRLDAILANDEGSGVNDLAISLIRYLPTGVAEHQEQRRAF